MKNSFSINITFLLLSIIGLALLPRLSIQLEPQHTGNAVYISYSWQGMGAEVLEREVTSPIEGALSALRGVKSISSHSYKGRGQVTLVFKKGTDMDAARFEVSSIMRSLHPRLPAGVQLPQVSYRGDGGENDPLLLVYTINGEGSSYALQEYVVKNIVPHISNLTNISRVDVSGAQVLEWEFSYDKDKLRLYGLSVYDLERAIQESMTRKELGQTTIKRAGKTETIHLSYSANTSDSLLWKDIVVAKSGGRLIYLTDIVSTQLKENEPDSYFRVNGLNTVYLRVNSAKGANQMALSKEITSLISSLRASFPQNFSMLVNYDASEHISKEIRKIVSRALLAIVILLLFVLLTSRRWRYLLIISLSLLANLCIGIIFYYFLGIEIHLYSLASFTVSLGIIIDNTIIMADHLRHSGNRKAFLAILAATITTIGSMSLIFFLKEEQRLNLMDFAVVIIINLSVSLAVALFFVPALLDRLPVKRSANRKAFRRRRRTAKLSRAYGRFILFGAKRKWAFVLILLWGFGFPVFFLPDKLESKEQKKWNEHSGEEKPETPWYISLYNETLGNQTYVAEVKPWVNKILGGSWNLFSNYYASQNFGWDNAQTRLWARGSMPDGSTIHQMNNVFVEIENFLAGFQEVDMFTSTIYSIDNASIEISFKAEHEHGAFPHRLKNELIRKANEIGSSDFSIYGVGQGFSNMSYDNWRNNRLLLKGYNYDILLQQADRIKDSLLTNSRIQEVIIQTGQSWRGKPRYEYVMGLDRNKLEETGSSLSDLYSNLLYVTPKDRNAGYIPGKDGMVSITLREANKNRTNVWTLENTMMASDVATYRLKDIGRLEKERTGDVIRKRNQEYELNVEYDFIGPWELNRLVRERYIEKTRASLPIGFSIREDSSWGGWQQDEKSQYWLLFIVLAVIFVLCSILFESLKQPLAVISAIPVSFIGLFLTFSLFKLNFDQGGYAALLLLCALTINASIYIINDYNNLKKEHNNMSDFALYMKAFNHKIIPILLTIFSTILGLLPFLLGGKNEGFWFSLAAGASGGLLFSLIALIAWLPMSMITMSNEQ